LRARLLAPEEAADQIQEGYAEATEPALIRPLALCTDWAKKPRQIRSSALRWMLREGMVVSLTVRCPDSASRGVSDRIWAAVWPKMALPSSGRTTAESQAAAAPHDDRAYRCERYLDSEVVIRLRHDSDLVSGAQIALDDDSEIGTGSQRC